MNIIGGLFFCLPYLVTQEYLTPWMVLGCSVRKSYFSFFHSFLLSFFRVGGNLFQSINYKRIVIIYVFIYFYHYLFCCSNCSKFGHGLFLQVSSCIFFTYPYLFSSTSFFFFFLVPQIVPSSFAFSMLKSCNLPLFPCNTVFFNRGHQNLETKCTHCYWGLLNIEN